MRVATAMFDHIAEFGIPHLWSRQVWCLKMELWLESDVEVSSDAGAVRYWFG